MTQHTIKVNLKRLKKMGACPDGMEWLESLGTMDAKEVVERGLREKEYQHLSWGISYLMNKKQRVTWAIFCAELCIGYFEKEFPDDSRPRKAIAAAKDYIKNPCEKTKSAARSAAWSAAWSAAESAAESAAMSARSAAWSAESAARSAAWSARSAAWSAWSAARSAAHEKMIWKGYETLGGVR